MNKTIICPQGCGRTFRLQTGLAWHLGHTEPCMTAQAAQRPTPCLGCGKPSDTGICDRCLAQQHRHQGTPKSADPHERRRQQDKAQAFKERISGGRILAW